MATDERGRTDRERADDRERTDERGPTDGAGAGVTGALLSSRGLRVALGVLWIVDGLLQAEPAKFASSYPLGDLAQSVMGSPPVIYRSIFDGIRPFVAHWPLWNLACVLLQLAIGAALISNRLTRTALTVSFVWGLVIWWLGEGFGTLPTGFATMLGGAPGPALLYVALGALGWPRRDRRDVSAPAWAAVWAVLWLGAAALHLAFQLPAGVVIQANLEENGLGQPRFLQDAGTWLYHLAATNGVAISFALAAVEAAVGLGALFRRGRRWWLAAAIAFSVFAWVVGQDLGDILTSDGTDPGLGPLVVLLALAAWPVSDRLRRSRSRPGHARAVGDSGAAAGGLDPPIRVE